MGKIIMGPNELGGRTVVLPQTQFILVPILKYLTNEGTTIRGLYFDVELIAVSNIRGAQEMLTSIIADSPFAPLWKPFPRISEIFLDGTFGGDVRNVPFGIDAVHQLLTVPGLLVNIHDIAVAAQDLADNPMKGTPTIALSDTMRRYLTQ